MKTIRLNSLAIGLMVPLLILLGNTVPEQWVEKWINGPFNHDLSGGALNEAAMVPNTFYHGNDTGIVTIWDETAEAYVSYDQETGEKLNRVVFNVESCEGVGGKVRIAGTMAVPTTRLTADQMKVQEEQGCGACHYL